MHPDIEAYLNGELQGESLELFEADLARDPELRAALELQRPVHRDLRLAAIARRVETAAANRDARRRIQRLAVIVVSVLLCLVGWYWWHHKTVVPIPPERMEPLQITPSKDTVQGPMAAPDQSLPLKPMAGNTVKNNAPTAPLFRSLPATESLPADGIALADTFLGTFDAIQYLNMAHLNTLWRNQNFEKYYQLLSERMAEKGRNDTTLLVQAACLLHLHRPKAAEKELYRLRNLPGRMGQEAKWLLTLGYVMQGKDDSALAALEAIAGATGDHQADARQLLQRLKE